MFSITGHFAYPVFLICAGPNSLLLLKLNTKRVYAQIQRSNPIDIPYNHFLNFFCTFFSDLIYLFSEAGEGKEKERERNISVWLLLTYPVPGTWPKTQACALTGNQPSDPLVRRPALNPLSYASQGSLGLVFFLSFYLLKIKLYY